MTNKQVSILFKGLDEHAEIIVSKDAEGNSYSQLAFVLQGVYVPSNSLEGRFYAKGTLEKYPEGKKAICLYPAH